MKAIFRTLFLCAILAIFWAPRVSAQSIPPAANKGPDLTNYNLTFSDNFSSLSTMCNDGLFKPSCKWYNGTERCCMSTTDGSGTGMFPTPLPGGGSLNPYSLISGGGLNISLTKVGKYWNSGVFTSVASNKQGFSQQYGYFEISAELPPGPGTWPAFWLLSKTPGGELDIFEQYGRSPTSICITLHDWTNHTNSKSNCFDTGVALTTGYHTYGMLWDANNMAFYLDGNLVWTVPTLAIAKQPYYVLADLGIGSGWPTDQTPSPSIMKIKYIHVYQHN
ncbi:MAG TPA: glycoside hydrolase family 16 protein [Methylocella sp.]|nr:glycoside hydrolase family 16 protein [Methylocella sp.]